MKFKKAIFRIIDANLNRSREGLRVCEDIARFFLNSPSLSRGLKSARHRVTAAARIISGDNKLLFDARDSEGDVGRRSRSRSEMKRAGIIGIYMANIERVKESLRVLEEFSKLIDKKASARFADIRFLIYGIEKSSLREFRVSRIIFK